ncbi:MAG: hypothetical protein Q9200_001514 [Gallowayella weberi]
MSQPSCRLAGKITVVTGASSVGTTKAAGLGRAIALAFASEGAALVVCADLQPIAKGTEFGAEAAGTPTHEVIQQRFGVNKAFFLRTNVTIGAEVERLVQEVVKAGGRLDVRSVFLGCKYACGQFLHQEPHISGHRGWIINTASIMGLVGQKVNGDLRTPMTQGQFEDPENRSAISAMTPWGDEWGSPQDVAKVAVFLASDDAAYVTGVPIPVDGGYCAQ